MNALNPCSKSNLDIEKILGKKVKRFKNSLKFNLNDMKKPPSLSKSTLNQIEKVIKNKNSKVVNMNTNLNQHISYNVDSQKYKFPELNSHRLKMEQIKEEAKNRIKYLIPEISV